MLYEFAGKLLGIIKKAFAFSIRIPIRFRRVGWRSPPPEGVGHLLEDPRERERAVEDARFARVADFLHPLVEEPVGDGDLVEVAAHGTDGRGVTPHQRTNAPKQGAVRAAVEAVGGQGGGDGVGGHGEYLRSFDG